MKCSKEKEIRNVFDNFFYFHMLRLTHGQMGIESLCQKVLFVLIKKKKKKMVSLFTMFWDAFRFSNFCATSCNKCTLHLCFYDFQSYNHRSKSPCTWQRVSLIGVNGEIVWTCSSYYYYYYYYIYIDSIFCLEKNLPSNHFVGKFL